MDQLIREIKELVSSHKGEVIGIRRHIHENPELSFEEYKTGSFVAEKLGEWGIPFETGWVKTGVVGLVEGKNPEKKCIALRADLDALPIFEENETDYVSKNKGVMHACGHDVHTANLLGVAYVLNKLKDKFEGSVKLIFQPGEEKLPGGAALMIKEGVLDSPKVENILGQHVFPELEAGKVGFRSGMYMASCDEIHAVVIGKGGHGAMPHQNIDPVLIASHIIVSLQQVISRNCPPEIPSVLSFGRIIGEGATNVIPNEVTLAGTFRTLNEQWRGEAHEKIISMARKIAESMGGKCEIRIDRGYPYLENEPEVTSFCKEGAIQFLGEKNVIDLPIRMTGEDFSYFSQKANACFYRLGVRNESKGITAPVHNSKFDIDEEALETGVGLMSWLAIKRLLS